MLTGGIILMAAMMGAMFLFGGHGKKHKHNDHASPEIAISSPTATAAPAAPVQVEEEQGAEHVH